MGLFCYLFFLSVSCGFTGIIFVNYIFLKGIKPI
jgi:hypothetical protein